MAVDAVIKAICLATETFDPPIVETVNGRSKVHRKFRHKALDITTALNAGTTPAVSMISAFSVVSSAAYYDIDLTALPRSVNLADGTSTFDATDKRVVYWRIRNKHATNVLAVNVCQLGGILVANYYPLFGSSFMTFANAADASLLSIMPNGHKSAYETANMATVSTSRKVIRLMACTSSGGFTSGVSADVTIMLG